ncbi:universal stress protein [Streptomyces sp. NPDC060035]|uniref:universal stress protein n=1 Tax=Streptomyces sp. NPDC060035 TaxID=3347044 RepID=UPI003675C32E
MVGTRRGHRLRRRACWATSHRRDPEGARRRTTVEVREHLTRGNPAEVLVAGSRGRGGFAGLLLGSVSQQCALRATGRWSSSVLTARVGRRPVRHPRQAGGEPVLAREFGQWNEPGYRLSLCPHAARAACLEADVSAPLTGAHQLRPQSPGVFCVSGSSRTVPAGTAAQLPSAPAHRPGHLRVTIRSRTAFRGLFSVM